MSGSCELTQQQIHDLLEKVGARAQVPGLIVGRVINGVRTMSAVGTASVDNGVALSADSRFQLGCLTKLLTCLVALQLAHEGSLSLNASIGEYLPEFGDTPKSRDITLRHLASHTSGYQGVNLASPEYAYFYSWEKFVRFFRESPQVFRPGSVFNYEHTECVLLGEIIRRVTGMTAEQLVRRRLLEPLGLKTGTIQADAAHAPGATANHTFDSTNNRYKAVRAPPYCGFWAASLADITLSTIDLVTLGEALIGQARTGLEPDTVVQARTQLVGIPPYIGGAGSEQMPVSFGFGCAGYAGSLLGHNGSARGQTCGIRFDPQRGMVIVVALNAWEPHLRDRLLNRVAGTPSSVESDAGTSLPWHSWPPQEFEGHYLGCLHGVDLSVVRQGDALVCTLTSRGTQASSSICVSREDTGRLVRQTQTRHLPVSFFHEPEVGTPCVMLGLNAFKRIS